MIETLVEKVRDEVSHAAYLLNKYDISTGQIMDLGPASDEQTAMAVPHTIQAAQLAKRLERVCLFYQGKSGDSDDIKAILYDLQVVYNMHDKAREWFAHYKPITQPL